MHLLGKFLGLFIGFGATQDSIGAVAGLLIGALFDAHFARVEKPYRERGAWQTEFSYLVTVLHAKFAKMDGQVTADEVRLFQNVVAVSKEDLPAVRAVYNQFRRSSDGFEHVAVRLSEMLAFDPSSKNHVVETLCYVMYGTGQGADLYQKAFIQAVARIFSIADADLQKLMDGVRLQFEVGGASTAGASSGQSEGAYNDAPWLDHSKAFKVLGLKGTATYEEMRKAYKKLIREHHPDKVRGAGGTDQDVEQAEDRLSDINEAYAVLCQYYDR